MPRINDPTQISERPTSVVFGELAIAAGIAGKSLTICYDNLTAAFLCEFCKYFIQGIGRSSFRHVRTQQHLRQVVEHLTNLRLILVQEPRLLSVVQWTVETALPYPEESASRPAILCGFSPPAFDELPGPTLVLQGNQRESAEITRWLAATNPAPGGDLEISAPSSIQYDPVLTSVLSSSRFPLQVRQVLSSFLAGASVIASAPTSVPTDSALTVTLERYEFVRRILQSALIRPVEDGFDQIALDMVNRANVYLTIKHGNDAENPFPPSEHDYHRQRRNAGAPRELVSRRDIADLGNTQSSLVRRLVEYLKRAENGLKDFAKLGLIRRPPSPTQWREKEVRSLVQYLRCWTAKQVRTHFEGLQREGLITAERNPSNGPWWYALPEQLTSAKSAFAILPEASELSSQVARAS